MSTRILVTEDNRTLRELIVKSLKRDGYEVDAAGSAAEMYASVSRARPDLLITDIHLPDNSELAGITAPLQGMPMIVITAKPSYQTALTALRAGVFEYLEKPFELSALRSAVNRALATSHRQPRPSWIPLIDGAPQQAAPEDVLDRLPAAMRARLSSREADILRQISRGDRAESIAEQLDISVHTVRNHIRALFRKLEVRSQIEMMAMLIHPTA
ncbi:MAG: response regulator [Myxococcota bacterium]